MKKFIAIMVAMAALVAFTAPAMADTEPGPSFVMGARILTDLGWEKSSKELTNNKKEDVTTAYVALHGSSYLHAKFTSADKTTGGLVEIAPVSSSNGYAAGTKAANSELILLRYAYGWWKVGNCKLVAGQNDGWVGPGGTFGPRQWMGLNQDGKAFMTNWGFIYGGRNPRVSFQWEQDMFGFAFDVVQPAAEVLPTLTATQDLYFNVPRLEAAFSFKAAGLHIQPGFGWSQAKIEGATAGGDDNSTQYMVVLPVRYSIGPFTLKANFHISQNNDLEWSGNVYTLNVYRGQLASVPVVQANGKIEDTREIGGMINAEYKITNEFEALAGFGVVKLENDAWKRAVSKGGLGYKDDNYTRKMFFVALPYKVTKNFTVHPEFDYYDYGDDLKNGGDFGNEWIVGMQLQFHF